MWRTVSSLQARRINCLGNTRPRIMLNARALNHTAAQGVPAATGHLIHQATDLPVEGHTAVEDVNSRMNGALIRDVFVKTEKNKFISTISLSESHDYSQYSLRQVLFPDSNAPIVGDAENPCAELVVGIQGKKALTTARATGIQWWSPSCPAMYSLTTELISPQGEVESSRVDRISFRDIQFDGKQFSLNGLPLSKDQAKDIKVMPLSVEQSFVEQCNEDGSLIVIEIDEAVDEKSLVEAVERLRNTPSVIAWSAMSKSLYKQYSALFSRLDGSRPVVNGFIPR